MITAIDTLKIELDITEPVPKLPMLGHPGFSARRHGDPSEASDVPEVMIYADVLEELCYQALYAADDCTACLLTGGWFLGPNGRYIEVDGFCNMMTLDDEDALLLALRRRPEELEHAKGELVLGPCVMRPNGEGKLLPNDFIVLNTFFNQPFSMMCIVDAQTDALGVYVRESRGLIHNVPCTVLTETDED